MLADVTILRRMAGVTLRVALCGTLLAGMPCGRAQDLGRVFFTPQQRQDMDRRRNTNVGEGAAVVENLVTVNGQVTRSSGKTTTWINGVPQYDTNRGGAPDRIGVESGTTTRGVKVGQTLDRNQGEVRDALQGGEIKINRAAQ